jgi:hypothetical protein
MSKQNNAQTAILSTFAVALLCLFSTVAFAQKGPQSTEGAPLKGVDVKLGKNPGGSAAARTFTSDDDGKISFGTLQPGTYTLTVLPPKKTGGETGKAASESDANVYDVAVTIGTGEPVVWFWDVAKKACFKAADPQVKTAGRPKYIEAITFVVSKPAEVKTTIKKGHSNVINNRASEP